MESPVTTIATHNHPVQLQVSFHAFSQLRFGFSWYQVGFYCFFKYPSWFFMVLVRFYGPRSVFMVFQGSRLVFHDSWCFFMILGRLLSSLMGQGWYFMITGGFLWLFMIPGWFLWLLIVPCRLSVFHDSRLFFMVFHCSRLV